MIKLDTVTREAAVRGKSYGCPGTCIQQLARKEGELVGFEVLGISCLGKMHLTPWSFSEACPLETGEPVCLLSKLLVSARP